MFCDILDPVTDEIQSNNQGRLVKTGCRAAALPEKCAAKDSAKRPNSP